jgi:hypothetical protein
MKKILITVTVVTFLFAMNSFAQSPINIPQVVKDSQAKRFPGAKNVTWETEHGNFEANWGGKSGEDNSVLYTPSGIFIEAGKAISAKQLPAPAITYLNNHYKGVSITEAMQVTGANGQVSYEAEVYGKDILFDEHGNLIKPGKSKGL